MPLDQEAITQQLELLAAHRRTLAVYLRQQADLGVLAPPGVVNGIEEAQSAIRRIKEQLCADGVPVEDEPNDAVRPPASTPAAYLSPQAQRNRRAMLTKVKTIWIEGLLEQSLAKELRIALDLTEHPDAVNLPLNALVQELSRPARELPVGTPIIKVFDQMGGALLILGAPGAGKTTLLLELARDLIGRAEQDEGHPIPVVFNLSSWATKRQPLRKWLIEELNTKYDVPRKLAQAWMDADVVLPLLDGLDEVAAAYRGDCVEAINIYRQGHGLVSLAVCSRVADYEALSTRLKLHGAVLIQPLSSQQISGYLVSAGNRLTALRVALRADAALRVLAEAPLMLSVMALVYQDMPVEGLLASGTLEERRKHLFAAYVERMFVRRGAASRYSRQQTIRWLGRLARGMVQQSQTVFLIEHLQPAWLHSHAARWKYALLDRLGSALIVGLIFWKSFWLYIIYALIGALIGGLFSQIGVESKEKQQSTWGTFRNAILGAFVCGTIVFLANRGLSLISPARICGDTTCLSKTQINLYNMLETDDYVPFGNSTNVLISVGMGALVGALAGPPSIHPRRIVVIETIRWSWARIRKFGLIGLIISILVTIIALIYYYPYTIPRGNIMDALFPKRSLNDIVIPVFIASTGISVLFNMIIATSTGEIIAKTKSNQGIGRSFRISVLMSIMYGLLMIVFFN